jgi:hypothetical protein
VNARLVRLLLAAVLCALAFPSAASADLAQEQALAARYAPVLQIVEHTDCPPGKPYLPIDVDLLFRNPTVALRGPWSNELVKIAPTAQDLARGLWGYHLDFPGAALAPACDYLDWERLLTANSAPTAYAHVVADSAHPGKLALQYWFFYVFNDWNNLHEGDWEMIQLVFDAGSPAQALERKPVEVGYSQHTGGERATWGDEKLQLIDGTHPVVHPAAGSHANFYGSALYLGSSADEGVGCDDTREPSFDLRPVIKTIPSDAAQARAQYPWIDFQGRWGELHPAFFNGPEGPNLKEQWTSPIVWSESWRDRAYTVPGGSTFGPAATDFFCTVVGRGSTTLVRLVASPLEFALLLGALVLVAIVLLSRTTWRPAAPLHVAHRRAWGQTLSASARMYVGRFPLFIGMGVLFVPISLLVSLIQGLLVHATNVLGVQQAGGSSNGVLGFLALAIGTALTLLGLGLVMAAAARALVEIDAGHPISPIGAYRLAADSIRPLFGSLLIAVVIISLLASSFFLIPVAVWLAGRWALIAPITELERRSAFAALHRSGQLTYRHWPKVASLIVAGAALWLVLGPLIGIVLILVTDLPFWLVNVVAGIVYAIVMPFVAITTTYVYADARIQYERRYEATPVVLPAETELSL